MKKLLQSITLIFALLSVAGGALAVDTWEPYPVGLRAFEFYGMRTGFGNEADADKGYGFVAGPAVGFGDRGHAYLFTGVSSTDEHLGGVDFLTVGFFQNLIDRSIDLDYWLEIATFGPGLAMASRSGGLELNFDAPNGGLFGRMAMSWENDGLDAEDKAIIGTRRSTTAGMYWQASPLVQLLGEMRYESTSGYDSIEDESRMTSWALGFNRIVSETTEIIVEVRSNEPPEGGDRSWDVTMGWVVVW